MLIEMHDCSVRNGRRLLCIVYEWVWLGDLPSTNIMRHDEDFCLLMFGEYFIKLGNGSIRCVCFLGCRGQQQRPVRSDRNGTGSSCSAISLPPFTRTSEDARAVPGQSRRCALSRRNTAPRRMCECRTGSVVTEYDLCWRVGG